MTIQEPEPMPLGASAEGAVVFCRDWMIYLGATEAVAASGAAREMCDLFSNRYLAWVDNKRGNLELDTVQRAVAVASRDGRQPLIFKRGGVRLEAQREADAHGVALFYYVPSDGRLEGANPLGRQLRTSGLGT